MKYKIIALLFLIVFSTQPHAETQFIKYKKYLIPVNTNVDCVKPKLIVSTDYGDWTKLPNNVLGADGGDAGEAAAMTHFLAYSNLFNVRGIISSITIGTGDAGEINKHLNAYKEDYDAFDWGNKFSFQRSFVVKAGIPVNSSNSLPGFNSSLSMNNAAVQLIVAEAKSASPACPLNIVVWGGVLEVTSALKYLDTNEPAAKANIRVIANGASNHTYTPDVGTSTQSGAWAAIDGLAVTGSLIKFDHLSTHMIARGCENSSDHNEKLYTDSSSNIVTTEDFMDAITDHNSNRGLGSVSPSSFPSKSGINGMRAFLQGARHRINANHCGGLQFPPFIKSMKSGDSLTLMYLLDDYFNIYNGVVKQYVTPAGEDVHGYPANDKPSVMPGNQVKREVYEHYRSLMNSLYE